MLLKNLSLCRFHGQTDIALLLSEVARQTAYNIGESVMAGVYMPFNRIAVASSFWSVHPFDCRVLLIKKALSSSI